MITENYVSFETAKLLMENGFEGECSRFYMPNGHGRWKYEHYHDFDISDRIECPTLQMAMKWLREVHNIHIEIAYNMGYFPICISTQTNDTIPYIAMGKPFAYEKACEVAIKYCLEHLI